MPRALKLKVALLSASGGSKRRKVLRSMCFEPTPLEPLIRRGIAYTKTLGDLLDGKALLNKRLQLLSGQTNLSFAPLFHADNMSRRPDGKANWCSISR
jgi:hypothetical protein